MIVFFFSTFMFLDVIMKSSTVDWFVTDYTVYSIDRFLHVYRKRTICVRISIVCGFSLMWRRVAHVLSSIDRIRSIGRVIYWLAIHIIVCNWVDRSRIIACSIRLRWRSDIGVVGLLIGGVWLWSIDYWYLLFFAEGVVRLGYPQINSPIIEINIDLEVEVGLWGWWQSLVWLITLLMKH